MVDLDAYADRIGFKGAFKPDLETLRGIALGHTCSIPFESCAVLLGYPIQLDTDSLQAKLVWAQRGGYCFEHNGFLLEVLQAIGFEARPLGGRVRVDRPRDMPVTLTHTFVVVKTEGAEWMMDVGIGSMSLTAPILMEVGREQSTPHEMRRIVFEDGRYYGQYLRGEEWMDVVEFTGQEMPLHDRELGNWWTSTHPRSLFKNNLIAALALPNGERKAVLNNVFNHRRGGEVLGRVELGSLGEVQEVLKSEFGLDYGVDVPCPGLENPSPDGRGPSKR